MGAKAMERLSELPVGGSKSGRKKPQSSILELHKCLADLGNDRYSKFLGNLENGATIGYMSDLGNCPEVSPCGAKQRVCAEKRQFLRNGKTAIGKEGALQTVINEDMEEGGRIGAFLRIGT